MQKFIQKDLKVKEFFNYINEKLNLKESSLKLYNFITNTFVYIKNKNPYTLESYIYNDNEIYYLKSYLIDFINLLQETFFDFDFNIFELIENNIITFE